MDVLKYIVIIALLRVSVLVSKYYCKFVDRSVAKVSSLQAFLKHIERKIGGYMTPANKLADGYEDDVISEMLNGIREGQTLPDAYACVREDLPPKIDEALTLYFGDFGKGDLRLELLRVREAISYIDGEIAVCKSEAEKQKKLCRAALPSIAIGVIIWFV